jgi:uncharacterized iron-regulated membrane protein
MRRFRQALFWLHLAAGLVAGGVIGIMCLTGTILAFEKQLVAWSERDARRITPPADAAPLPLEELQRRLRETQPEFRPASITVHRDPAAAIAFTAGRDDTFYASPYDGVIRKPASTRTRDFMHVMEDWHRFLALPRDQRPTGKLINGICNLAFFGLAVTGLCLWWPRTWSWRGLKAVAVINFKATGRTRDFNWHNAIGFWCAPILMVLTVTAVPISFRWGGTLISRLTGEEPLAQPSPGAPTAPAVAIHRPTPDARPLGLDALLAHVQREFPRWESITLRTGATQQRDGARQADSSTRPGRPDGEARRGTEGQSGSQPVTATVREAGSWPRTAITTLTLNPFTGEVLNKTGYADLSPARQIRSWMRFLHTGEALGVAGQAIAGLAALGGCFLVYTGFALAWRRFAAWWKGAVPTPM